MNACTHGHPSPRQCHICGKVAIAASMDAYNRGRSGQSLGYVPREDVQGLSYGAWQNGNKERLVMQFSECTCSIGRVNYSCPKHGLK